MTGSRKTSTAKGGSARSRSGLTAVAAVVAVVAITLGIIFGVRYAKKSKVISNVKKEVSVSYGTPLTVDIFLNEGADASLCPFVSDVSPINMDDLASYQLTLMYD